MPDLKLIKEDELIEIESGLNEIYRNGKSQIQELQTLLSNLDERVKLLKELQSDSSETRKNILLLEEKLKGLFDNNDYFAIIEEVKNYQESLKTEITNEIMQSYLNIKKGIGNDIKSLYNARDDILSITKEIQHENKETLETYTSIKKSNLILFTTTGFMGGFILCAVITFLSQKGVF